MNSHRASSSTNARFNDGCAVKSNSSRDFNCGNLAAFSRRWQEGSHWEEPLFAVGQFAFAQPQQEAQVVGVLLGALPRYLLTLRLDRRQTQGRQVMREQQDVGRHDPFGLHDFTPFREVKLV
jgi:hypothetical protein